MKPSSSGRRSPQSSSDDRGAGIEQLLMPHLDAAYNFARWLTRSEQDAADIVHEAYLRALRYADSYAGGNPRAWWLTIVRTTYLSWLAKASGQRAHLPLEEIDEDTEGGVPGDPARNPEELAHWSQCAGVLTQLLEALPPGFREIIVLREMEELSYREIADLLQIPMGTVMSRLARARELLKRAWAAHAGK